MSVFLAGVIVGGGMVLVLEAVVVLWALWSDPKGTAQLFSHERRP